MDETTTVSSGQTWDSVVLPSRIVIVEHGNDHAIHSLKASGNSAEAPSMAPVSR